MSGSRASAIYSGEGSPVFSTGIREVCWTKPQLTPCWQAAVITLSAGLTNGLHAIRGQKPQKKEKTIFQSYGAWFRL